MNFVNKILFILIFCIPKSIIKIIAKKYIAGEGITDAIAAIKKLNAKGIMATVDILGENVKTEPEAENAVELYKDLLKRIHQDKLNATISLKPSHLGLRLDKKFCYQNISSIVSSANDYNNFVHIDMEDHTCTSDTLEIFTKLNEKFKNVGIALQSRLRRTLFDINILIASHVNIRLCKGAYFETPEIAFQNNEMINKNFIDCLEKLLRNKCYVCIATHDEELVRHSFAIINRLKLKDNEYEFQVLLGVNESLWDHILKEGHHLRVYVPFGEEWYEYSMRRFKENPNLIKYIIKQLF
jgi:proline dehydrogenase